MPDMIELPKIICMEAILKSHALFGQLAICYEELIPNSATDRLLLYLYDAVAAEFGHLRGKEFITEEDVAKINNFIQNRLHHLYSCAYLLKTPLGEWDFMLRRDIKGVWAHREVTDEV